MNPGEVFLLDLGSASLGAAGLILVILLLRRMEGLASARWRMVLWTVLVARMAFSWAPIPAFTFSLPNPLVAPRSTAGPAPFATRPVELPKAPAPVSAPIRPFPWASLLLAGWALGATVFLARSVQANVSLGRAVRRGRVLTHQPTLDLLERCKDDLGVRTVLGIIVTERVPSPALFGLVRPRLLLPPQVLETLSTEALRHVFLHELVHLKRWDILMAWVCSVLQILHWFNPFVWLAFRRMRTDRELACDEGAVRILPSSEKGDYGRTLLRLQELLAPPTPLPIFAGIVEEASPLTWRIKMIAKYKQTPNAPRWTPLSIGLLSLFALGAFSFSFALRGDNLVHPNLAHPKQDKVDYPFVEDPEVIGTWRPQAFLKSPEDFVPNKTTKRDQTLLATWEREMPFMMPLSVHPQGATSCACRWTKGLFLFDNGGNEKTASRYLIKTSEGIDYLLMEFKNGDYTFRGMTPEWIAFRRESRIPVPPSKLTDKVDYPFVNDPQVIGTWHTVDFVNAPENFHPGSTAWKGDLYLKGMTLLPEGKTDNKGLTWTDGLILNPSQKTASRYTIRTFEGHPYLFMEWKSGDYTDRGMRPKYYVLTR